MTSESQELLFHTILHLLFTLCIVYPPVEFQRAGITIQTLFSRYLGVEQDDFVGYHLRRSVLTRFIHFCSPLFYFIYLSMVLRETIFTLTPQTILQFGAYASVATAGVAAFIMLCHWRNRFDEHPTVHCLKRYLGNDESSWYEVAESINAEYRNILDTLSISLTAPVIDFNKSAVCSAGIDRVVMTSSWILNITNYTLTCAQVSDVSLEAIRADEHPISHHMQSGGSAQFISICIKSTTQRFEPFVIRVRAESFRDLRNKLDKPIALAREVVLKQSLNERFVEAFTQQIGLNPRYDYGEPEVSFDRSNNKEKSLMKSASVIIKTDIGEVGLLYASLIFIIVLDERLEPCLGCSSELSNVKLWKRCLNDVQDDMDAEASRPRCEQCYCRPMWCDTCMGLIFASKQDPHRPELWMPGKAQCPTCRATFCVLDVAFLNIIR
ncbi:Transmembrane protein [Dirofilaria immitis]|nr:Transmembrane protein [Dirofilaria immitis]